MNIYPAGMTEAELDGGSLLDHKSHDELVQEMFDWCTDKQVFEFYLDNMHKYEGCGYEIGDSVWDLLDRNTKYKLAEKFIVGVAYEEFVDSFIEKYEEVE